VKKFRNKRREVLARLADMKRAVTTLSNVFTVESRVYEEHGTRARRPEEYPENKRAYWEWLAVQAEDLMIQADALRTLARDEVERMAREAYEASRQK
jgi:hypothetical protein